MTPALPELSIDLDPTVAPWPGEDLALGRRTLFVRRATAPGAEPAVFVHGLGGASTNWTDLMFLLRGRYDCWAPDLPGFGRSEPPPGNDYSFDSHVIAVTRMLEHVVAEAGVPVHLFGNSLGGAVCVRIAASRPDLVRTLTLVSPAMPVLRPRRGTDPRLLLLLLPGTSRALTWISRRESAADRVNGILGLCMADPSLVPPGRFAEAVEELERRRTLPWFDTAMLASLRGLAASYLERGPRTLWRQAGDVRVPTLIIWGRQDQLVSVQLAARTQASVSGSRLVLLDNCGHVAQIEDPVRVAREFLALV